MCALGIGRVFLWRTNMLQNSTDSGPTPEAQPRDPPRIDGSLTRLLDQERMWFSWVTVLHERLDKLDMPSGGHDILEIARKRWLEAREALRRHQAGD